jgi:hypothetical protein
MPDYATVFLSGMATGFSIILAQRIVKFIDEQSLTRKVKKEIDKLILNKKDYYER